MATKHRGKAAQAAWAAKKGEKISRARENWNPEAAKRAAETDHERCIERAKAGRPPLDGTAKRAHSIHMTADHIATARRLGNGNISAGVRLALERAEK